MIACGQKTLTSGLQDAATILWSDLVALRRRIFRYLIATVVSPLLYMIAFGYGLGTDIKMEGSSYLEFVIPGIIALTAMNSSFNGSGTRLYLDQVHYRSFDESLMAPVSSASVLLGKALIGVVRGMISSTAFLVVAAIICPKIHIGPLFILGLVITCMAFSFLGVLVALLSRSYEDLITFTSLILMPMTFLGGTFFSLSRTPYILKLALYALPLTHSSIYLRAVASDQPAPMGSLFAIICFLMASSLGCMIVLKRMSV